MKERAGGSGIGNLGSEGPTLEFSFQDVYRIHGGLWDLKVLLMYLEVYMG